MAEHRSSLAVAVASASLVGLALVGLFSASPGLRLAVFGLGLVAAGALSAFLFAARAPQAAGTAGLWACLPLCLYLAASTAVVTASSHDRAWDAARLTPSIAWAHGHAVYASETDGAVHTTMYPPAWVLAYLPAALAPTPAGALQIGIALTLFFSLAPVLFILWRVAPDPALAAVGFASFVALSRLFPSLEYSVFQVHVDAPSLGLALAACALLLRGGEGGRDPARWTLPTVALLAWLSVWTKQVMLPLLVALPLWLWLVQGAGQALRLAAWLAVAGAVVAATLLALFPLEGVWFNVVTIPARAPWRLDEGLPRALQLVDASVELLRHALPLLLFLGAGLAAATWLRGPPGSAPSLRARLADSPWALPLWVAACMLPVSVLGRVKVGGDANTLSPTTYFLLVSCIVLALRIPALPRGAAGGEGLRQRALGLLACAALLVGVVATAEAWRRGLPAGHVVRHPTQLAWEHLRDRDPRAFFPTHPLAHLLADGSFYHLAMALHDRELLSSLPLSPAQRSAFLPARPSMVCWDWSWGVGWVARNYFQAYVRETHPPDLGDRWECYVPGA